MICDIPLGDWEDISPSFWHLNIVFPRKIRDYLVSQEICHVFRSIPNRLQGSALELYLSENMLSQIELINNLLEILVRNSTELTKFKAHHKTQTAHETQRNKTQLHSNGNISEHNSRDSTELMKLNAIHAIWCRVPASLNVLVFSSLRMFYGRCQKVSLKFNLWENSKLALAWTGTFGKVAKSRSRPWLRPSIKQVNPDRATSKITLNSTFSQNLTLHFKKLFCVSLFDITDKMRMNLNLLKEIGIDKRN